MNSVREHLPGADGKIVFDKFPIAQHLGNGVDRVRRRENKLLRAAGDDRLAGTRYDWLRHPARMEAKDANWAVRSRLPPMIEVARMLKRRFDNIVTYLRHRITNAASAGGRLERAVPRSLPGETSDAGMQTWPGPAAALLPQYTGKPPG